MTTTPTSNPTIPATNKPRGFHLIRTVDGVEIPAAGLWNIPSTWASVEVCSHRRFRKPFRAKLRLDEGTITVADDPAYSTVSIRLDATSIDTGNEARNQFLRQTMLDADRHPTIGVRIVRTMHVSGRYWKANGWVSLRGVTAPILFAVSYEGVDSRGPAAHFLVTASVPLKRLVKADGRLRGRFLEGRYLDITAEIHAQPVWVSM